MSQKPSLSDLAANLTNPTAALKIEETPRRVRGLLNKEFIFDTIHARHVWEKPYYPHYYIPKDALSAELFLRPPYPEAPGVFPAIVKCAKEELTWVLVFEEGPLKGLVRFEMDDLDAWFEEDEPIYGHPKDPYKRIDTLPTSRNITVEIDGVIIASSNNNMFLFETSLRPRYYMPKTRLQWQYITKSNTTTRCPYKGLANYYNVTVNGKMYKDVLWWYKYPTAESARIAGFACFYNEKVDVFIDGTLEKYTSQFI